MAYISKSDKILFLKVLSTNKASFANSFPCSFNSKYTGFHFSVSFSPPTNYSVSVSGKYYDALDRNRTNLVNRCERKGD